MQYESKYSETMATLYFTRCFLSIPNTLYPHPDILPLPLKVLFPLCLCTLRIRSFISRTVSPFCRSFLERVPYPSSEISTTMSPAELPSDRYLYLERSGRTFAKAVMTPIPIPTPRLGAAKNAIPLPNVPRTVPPNVATIAPTAAYFAYRKSRRMIYLMAYLSSTNDTSKV